MEERMIISEVALSQDKPIQQWKATELGKVKDCYDRCHVEGRTQIRECNSACLGGLIQALWTRVNIEEFDQIAMKYA